MAKRIYKGLSPTQRRVQDALRVIVEWEREVFQDAGRDWEARRDRIFWGLLSYIEKIGKEDLPLRWFELAEEALLKALPQDAQERVEKRIREATLTGFSRKQSQRKIARRRGKQQTDARMKEWNKYQTEAERLLEINSHLSLNEVGRKIREKIFKKEGREVGLRTITNRIKRPT